jgi:hypothetical protein
MAGAHNVRATSEPHRVEITSYKGFTHENWDSSTLSNDVALIELPKKIDFNDWIRPACLPAKGDTADAGELVTATGWGKPSDSAGGISAVLRMVSDLPIITNQECNAVYGIVGPGVVCISTKGGKGTCNVSIILLYQDHFVFYSKKLLFINMFDYVSRVTLAAL